MSRGGALNEVNEEDESYTNSTLGSGQPECHREQKILGIRWDFDADQFVFDLHTIACLAQELEPTKRHVVSIASKFYDPIGFVSPITIRFKFMFQELCKSKMGWDQQLSEGLLSKWKSLVASLQESQPIVIPRSYLHGVTSASDSYSLQGFCDASSSAYAAVVYCWSAPLPSGMCGSSLQRQELRLLRLKPPLGWSHCQHFCLQD